MCSFLLSASMSLWSSCRRQPSVPQGLLPLAFASDWQRADGLAKTALRKERRDEAENQFRDASHRGSRVSDNRLQLGNRRAFVRHRVGQRPDLAKALAIKNANIVCELSVPPCKPARCKKILQDWREASLL